MKILFSVASLTALSVCLLASLATSATHPTLKIYVVADRLYRVTGQEIENAGLRLDGVDQRRINLYNEGRAVPIAIDGLTAYGTFGVESSILFWGEFPRGKETRADVFTRENVYTLILDSADPPRRYVSFDTPQTPVAEEPLILTRLRTAHFERDSAMFFFQHYDGLPTDRVMWRSFQSPPREGHSLTLDTLSDIAPGKQPSKIRMFLWGTSYLPGEPDHDWSFYLNDGLLGRAQWDARTHIVFESESISQYFRARAPNTLTMKSNQQGDKIDSILLDWIEIEYEAALQPTRDFLAFELPGSAGVHRVRLAGAFSAAPIRVFDVDNGFELPVESGRDLRTKAYTVNFRYGPGVEDARLAAVGPGGFAKPARMAPGYPSDLRGIKMAPQYVLITHRDFIDDARQLVERRRSQGLSALLVDIEDIYDEYTYGRFSPQAIKLFIDDLLAKPAAGGKGLRYVFLVGDATYDYKGVYKNSNTFVPTYHSTEEGYLPDYQPMYALDDYFVYGPSTEHVPRAAIGRLPCRTPEEFRHFLDKVVQFEAPHPPDSNDQAKQAVLIGAEGFTGMCDQVATQAVLRDWKLEKIYAMPGDVQGNVKLQAKIVESLSRGPDAVYFVGHGAYLRWRTGPVDPKNQTDLFSKEHMDKLTNRGRYPVAFTATCYSAMYDNPILRGGSEAGIGVFMVQAEGKGAIACIAHVGKTSAGGAQTFSVKVMQELYGGSAARLGDAYLAAKHQYHSGDWAGMTMIGDPATFFGTRYAASGTSFTNTP